MNSCRSQGHVSRYGQNMDEKDYFGSPINYIILAQLYLMNDPKSYEPILNRFKLLIDFDMRCLYSGFSPLSSFLFISSNACNADVRTSYRNLWLYPEYCNRFIIWLRCFCFTSHFTHQSKRRIQLNKTKMTSYNHLTSTRQCNAFQSN